MTEAAGITEASIREALAVSKASGSCIVDIGATGPRLVAPDAVAGLRES